LECGAQFLTPTLLMVGMPWRARQLCLFKLLEIGGNKPCYVSQGSAAGVGGKGSRGEHTVGGRALNTPSPLTSTPQSTLCMLHPREPIPEVTSNGF
jgi:hypothetical protein